jgi:hypothetical protein
VTVITTLGELSIRLSTYDNDFMAIIDDIFDKFTRIDMTAIVCRIRILVCKKDEIHRTTTRKKSHTQSFAMPLSDWPEGIRSSGPFKCLKFRSSDDCHHVFPAKGLVRSNRTVN